MAHEAECPGPEDVCGGFPGLDGEGPVGFGEGGLGVSGSSEEAGCLG